MPYTEDVRAYLTETHGIRHAGLCPEVTPCPVPSPRRGAPWRQTATEVIEARSKSQRIYACACVCRAFILVTPISTHTAKRPTVIFSHGNAEDLGPNQMYAQMLANMMDADVLAYDYVNYGLSSRAITTERNMQQAVEAVFNVAIYDLCIPANRIVLYGKSIGTAPTLYLAAQRCADEILGVIVVAPLASGIRALMHTTYIPNTLLKQLDRAFCPSIEYIEKIRRPVFIIHGLEDTVIEVENGRFLHNKLNSLSHYPALWVHAGHNDIEEKCRATLMAKIPAFLEYAKRNRGGEEKVD